jgi:steroid 5-alpha reductase family enzyme
VPAIAVRLSPVVDGRSILLLGLVVIWVVRWSAFLFRRIHAAGKDPRFDELQTSFPCFLMTWTLQCLWATLAAALAAIMTTVRKDLGLIALAGFLVWLIGIAFEAAADARKSRFQADPANRRRFLDGGLWAWSRRPNVFGEIVLCIDVAFIALPVLRGSQWVALISPVSVVLLLTRICGVPMLEK